MERSEKAWAWRELAVEPASSTTQPISLICGRRKRRQGGSQPKIESQASRRERYLHRSRKKGDTPVSGGGEDHTGEDHTRGHGFDELARSLAEGSLSRRRALKLFAGTAIAALIPSRAMAAVTCPPGTVKVCDVPRRADGTCRRGAAVTRCVTPAQAATVANNPCSCCGGCGGTDQLSSAETSDVLRDDHFDDEYHYERPRRAPRRALRRATPTTTTTSDPTTTRRVCTPTAGRAELRRVWNRDKR